MSNHPHSPRRSAPVFHQPSRPCGDGAYQDRPGYAPSPHHPHRSIINGILWLKRTGASWRDIPERYGKWETIASRYYRWCQKGLWQTMWEQVQAHADARGALDWDTHYVDSSVIRAHQHAAGAYYTISKAEALGRSQGGFSTKIHLRAEGGGKPMTFVLTVGQRNEAVVFEQLMEHGAVKRPGVGRPRLRPKRVVAIKPIVVGVFGSTVVSMGWPTRSRAASTSGAPGRSIGLSTASAIGSSGGPTGSSSFAGSRPATRNAPATTWAGSRSPQSYSGCSLQTRPSDHTNPPLINYKDVVHGSNTMVASSSESIPIQPIASVSVRKLPSCSKGARKSRGALSSLERAAARRYLRAMGTLIPARAAACSRVFPLVRERSISCTSVSVFMASPSEGHGTGKRGKAGQPRRESSNRHEVLVYCVVGHVRPVSCVSHGVIPLRASKRR
ncbi:IS5 family transposase [Candidatus Gracilibacteria bacterium]|nr:IS5 family transposase [Candidatus Gracilibacteria bacterium]